MSLSPEHLFSKDPKEVSKKYQILKTSSVLNAFLQDQEDTEVWFTQQKEVLVPLLDEIEAVCGEVWADVATLALVRASQTENVFAKGMYEDSRKKVYLQFAAGQIVIMGYEIGFDSVLEEFVPDITDKVASLEYIQLASEYTLDDSLEKFVKSCLNYGADLREKYGEEIDKKKRNPKLDIYGEFIKGLDLDDFTGKRS